MEKNILLNYSLIKTLFENQRDYIDTFCIFVIKIIKDFNKIDLELLQDLVFREYKIMIPLNTIKTILVRAKHKGFIDNDSKLTEIGLKHLDKLETSKEVERRINELIFDLKEFLGNKELTETQVYELLLEFINRNIYSVVEFCTPNKKIELNISKKA
jgi:hypothetical protein